MASKKQRSVAAKKGWETRRKLALKRSRASKRGWETRRKVRATTKPAKVSKAKKPEVSKAKKPEVSKAKKPVKVSKVAKVVRKPKSVQKLERVLQRERKKLQRERASLASLKKDLRKERKNERARNTRELRKTRFLIPGVALLHGSERNDRIVLKAMIDMNDRRWVQFFNLGEALGLGESQIRNMWFSPK